MGTMPIGLGGMMGGGTEDDPIFNMSDTDYVGFKTAAQKRKDEQEEFKKQLLAQQQARQQQMAPLQQPLQQMIDEREQREGVGTARGTIIEMLRAIAQNKNYKPITDKIREEETKTHTANMAQLKAMDLEDKLSQKDIELQMKNQQFGQMMAQKQADTQARYAYNNRLIEAKKELAQLSNKGKLDVAQVIAKAREKNITPEELAMISTGVAIEDPENPKHITHNPDATPEQFGNWAEFREKLKLAKGSGQPQSLGYETTGNTTVYADGSSSTSRLSRKIFPPQAPSNTKQGVVDLLSGRPGQQQQSNVLTSKNPWSTIGNQQQSDPQAATVTTQSGKKVANPLAVISLEQSQIPAAKNMGEFMRLRPHLIQFQNASFLPNGYVNQSTIGNKEPANRKAEVNDYRKNLSDADSFAGNFAPVGAQMGDMYLKGMDKMMLTSNTKNLIVNAATSWVNGRAQKLLKLGLKDTEFSDFINLRDMNLQTLQEKLTAVGGKTLTESEQRIVKDYWPQNEFSDPENMLNAYARFNMLNKLKVYRMKHNMLSSGTEFLSGQILDKDGKVIGDSISNYVDKSVKEIKALKDAGKIDAARKKIADLMNADAYFDTKMDQELHRDKYQKRRVRI